jgi:hypothetical protein
MGDLYYAHEFGTLASIFDTLTVEQMREIDAEPEAWND